MKYSHVCAVTEVKSIDIRIDLPEDWEELVNKNTGLETYWNSIAMDARKLAARVKEFEEFIKQQRKK